MGHDAPQELRPDIEIIYHAINHWLGHIGCRPEIACSALMALTTSLCAQSLETDEAIIESFKLCLLDASVSQKIKLMKVGDKRIIHYDRNPMGKEIAIYKAANRFGYWLQVIRKKGEYFDVMRVQ